MGALRPFFVSGGWYAQKETSMNQKTRNITHAALIGTMYFALTHLQNFLIPNSATWVIQFRASEALCVLAFFTPAAIPGLTIGCLLFNLSFAGALPLDFLVGSLATLLAAGSMRMLRRAPWAALSMPALFNAILVGWELTVYLGSTSFTMAAFWINAFYVAIGELAVLYTLGWLLYRSMTRSGMAHRIFGNT
jgi:uncharacterized membrane protein